jgi:hypothetical protein
MGLAEKALPVKDVVALSRYVILLFHEALPDPSDRGLFDRLMHEARQRGLTWLQGLEYVAERRSASFCL